MTARRRERAIQSLIRRRWASATLLTIGFVPWTATARQTTPEGVYFYSTAAPPRTYSGPTPDIWEIEAVAPIPDAEPAPPAAEETIPAPAPMDLPPPAGDETAEPPADRLATAPAPREPATALDSVPASSAKADPIRYALDAIEGCAQRYAGVSDYTATFLKRERIDGQLSELNVLKMKGRSKPSSVYFKFERPNQGREAIYVDGRNDGRAIVHDVGINKFLAGTLALDPRSRRAMDGNRHPITDAGLGHLIETIEKGWKAEMTPQGSVVTINEHILVNKRPCTLIVSNHPSFDRKYQFHEVRVYIDHELGLPVRFEAYDWPKVAGAKPELLEEYTYTNLKLNVGLGELDFDPSNKAYSFGRF